MRIWSIHPKYLDTKGLVALWREALLAKHVLEDKTKGYRNHPQLTRFKNCSHPLHAINHYLSVVWEEAGNRGYRFDRSKVQWTFNTFQIPVTLGQVAYEIRHLENKLRQRDPVSLTTLPALQNFEVHPLFHIIEGGVEDWEIV